jgi:two-component system alkaline phosphatase synthesis response regulator PhoP
MRKGLGFPPGEPPSGESRGVPFKKGGMAVAKRILLCDDEIHILRAAEIKLAASGFDVRIAHDGQEAWEAILRERPDVLVTDVQMPRCNGIELARRIRANPATRDLPIIMLTAKTFEFQKQDLVSQIGIVEILPKPFSPRELFLLIEGILGEAGATAR